MAQTKQEVIRQIQQGKIQSALEGMVQLSGLARDKELQQRCVLLQSQLSQLNAKFGMGTFDNKTYQLELNRITQAALEMAYDMPAVVAAPPQYTQTSYPRAAPSSGSAWKTWGILLTGAGAVVVLMVVMNSLNQPSPEPGTQTQTSFTNPQSSQQPQTKEIQQDLRSAITPSKPVLEAPKSEVKDQYVGGWQGVVSTNGVSIAGLYIHFQDNGNYESQLVNLYTNDLISSSRGAWRIEQNGSLTLRAVEGPQEVYSVGWTNPNSFNAVMVNATDPSLIGMRIAFIRND